MHTAFEKPILDSSDEIFSERIFLNVKPLG